MDNLKELLDRSAEKLTLARSLYRFTMMIANKHALPIESIQCDTVPPAKRPKAFGEKSAPERVRPDSTPTTTSRPREMPTVTDGGLGNNNLSARTPLQSDARTQGQPRDVPAPGSGRLSTRDAQSAQQRSDRSDSGTRDRNDEVGGDQSPSERNHEHRGDEDGDGGTDDENDDQDDVYIQKRLQNGLLPIAPRSDISTTRERRTQFYRRLRSLEVPIQRNNKWVTMGFTATEIIEITNFMFSDLTGPKAVERVASLVERYSQDRGDIPDTRSSKRAEEAADHPDTPSQLQAFFKTYSRAAAKKDHNNILEHVCQLQRDLEFLAELNRLQELTKRKDPEILKLFDNHNIKSKSGSTLMNRLTSYICDTLSIKKNEFWNFVSGVQATQGLVSAVGSPGVIILIPPLRSRKFVHSLTSATLVFISANNL